MRVLLVTDIHSDYTAAELAGDRESPDLVLDCGDHEKIVNLFGAVPHFYIRGNHEPQTILADGDLPHCIPPGALMQFPIDDGKLSIFGIDGNYGSKETLSQVSPAILVELKQLLPGTVDLMLVHESPLNVAPKSRSYSFAQKVLTEIERIKPKFIFSGHSNIYSETTRKNGVRFVNLEDMCNGYGLLEVDAGAFHFERRQTYTQT